MIAEVSAGPSGPSGLPPELAEWPAWTPDELQLADLEMLLSGAFAPLAGFMRAADVAAVAERGSLADGTPWPVTVTLDVPAAAIPADADHLVLQDQEGTPLAVLEITERLPAAPAAGPRAVAAGDEAGGTLVRLAGPVTALREPAHGPFRRLRRRPAELREEFSGGTVSGGTVPASPVPASPVPASPVPASPVLAWAGRGPLHRRQIGQLRHLADQLKARLLLLPLVAGPADVVVRPESLVRAVLAARQLLPAGTLVVPVPLAPRAGGAGAESRARALVAAAYGATHLLADAGQVVSGGRNTAVILPGMAIPLATAGEWAYDPMSEVWRPLALIEPGAERGELSNGELADLLDRGEPPPGWFTPEAVARELRRARPPRSERGLVIFLTGLSGSGKSTIARDLRDALTERGDRTVSLVDGDHVRRLLSAGLTFSRADRDLNIARIGYVAAEIARHGGIAICAPIAPYAAARARARAMAAEAGDFLLVYVATPVEVCEARDRKGLYARARAGLIEGFTGVSDPYEEPRDADLVLDTSAMTRQEAVDAVLGVLISGGWLDRTAG